MILVLGHHDLDGHEGHATAAREDEREEDLLLLGQVALYRVVDLFEVLGQPRRAQGVVRSFLLHGTSAGRQLGQVPAQRLVIAAQDEFDYFRGRALRPKGR